ncbi:type II toxin-antitoxin system YafQ family toxin [Falcatimonas sp. MSJ-15]|uniref:type II toxin-antitoxin system YafQ family toxin n=1 Tax=Falcatimonas sp. MSJ-15 TaxID=2841515 RepID=UPI003530035F
MNYLKNLDKLFEVIDILANGDTLEAKYRDHDLTGNYKGTRECHIEPDWLLIIVIQKAPIRNSRCFFQYNLIALVISFNI